MRDYTDEELDKQGLWKVRHSGWHVGKIEVLYCPYCAEIIPEIGMDFADYWDDDDEPTKPKVCSKCGREYEHTGKYIVEKDYLTAEYQRTLMNIFKEKIEPLQLYYKKPKFLHWSENNKMDDYINDYFSERAYNEIKEMAKNEEDGYHLAMSQEEWDKQERRSLYDFYKSKFKVDDNGNEVSVSRMQTNNFDGFSQNTKNVPKCPTCGSTNITKIDTLDRVGSVAVMGLASKKIGKQFKCKNCGYMW